MICGPSGAGKSTLVKNINHIFDVYVSPISCTTKDQNQEQEVHGKDYYFISREEFLIKKECGKFAETNPFMKGSLYGTLWSEFERILALGKVPALDIDINGVCALDQLFPRDRTFRLYLDVTEEEQRRRLEKRARDSAEKIEQRIMHAREEKEQLLQLLHIDSQLFSEVRDYTNVRADLYANKIANLLREMRQALV